MNMNMTLPCAVLILTSALAGAAETSNGADQPRTEVVGFADLNLESPAEVAVLYRRIKYAARRVCEASDQTRQVGIARLVKECRILTTDHAVRQIALPALTQLHLGTSEGQSKPDRLAKKR